MPTKKNKQIQINYTNRDFESVKKELVQIAERFYPDTFRDFSEASFGSMMLDSVALGTSFLRGLQRLVKSRSLLLFQQPVTH
jgi:hypothetical protein